MTIEFGREICGSLEIAEQREWLVTNGVGGYASGTVSGLVTRRYHGWLVAALPNPLGRTVMLTHVSEQVSLPGVGTNWHTLKMVLAANQLTVFYDQNQILSIADGASKRTQQGR